MTSVLLDTDTVSLLLRLHPQVTLNASVYIKQFGQLTFTEFTYYEITRGLKAAGSTTKLASFEQFCLSHRIVPFSHDAAIIAADIWSDLKQRGLLIGEVDLLIASVALSERLAVATHNTQHFNRIVGLQIEDWTI